MIACLRPVSFSSWCATSLLFHHDAIPLTGCCAQQVWGCVFFSEESGDLFQCCFAPLLSSCALPNVVEVFCFLAACAFIRFLAVPLQPCCCGQPSVCCANCESPSASFCGFHVFLISYPVNEVHVAVIPAVPLADIIEEFLSWLIPVRSRFSVPCRRSTGCYEVYRAWVELVELLRCSNLFKTCVCCPVSCHVQFCRPGELSLGTVLMTFDVSGRDDQREVGLDVSDSHCRVDVGAGVETWWFELGYLVEVFASHESFVVAVCF